MKKVIYLIAICFIMATVCQAKTISWVESDTVEDITTKSISIAEDVVETKSITISDLEHQIQQHGARSDYQLELKTKKEAELAELMTALKLSKVDGIYTTLAVVAIEK